MAELLPSSAYRVLASADMTDASTGGGPVTASVIPSGAVGQVFKFTAASELTSGSDKYRFIVVHMNVAETALDKRTLTEAFSGLYDGVAGDAEIRIAAAPYDATKASFVDGGSPTWHEGGAVAAAITAGDVSVQMSVKRAVHAPLSAGLLYIRSADGLTSETVRITGAATLAGSVYTIPVEAVANSYTTTASIGSAPEHGSLRAGYENAVKTFASGDVDLAQLTVYAQGASPQTITFTFSDASNFTVESDQLGTLSAGTVGADYEPTGLFGSKILTLPSAAWTTPQAGDTLVLDIVPMMVKLCIWRHYEPGSTSGAGDLSIWTGGNAIAA